MCSAEHNTDQLIQRYDKINIILLYNEWSMEIPQFDLLKKKAIASEIKSLLDLGEKYGIDLTKGIREVKKGISIAEQVTDSKLIDEFLIKAKRELDRAITDFVMKKFYEFETEVKKEKVSNRQLEICLTSAFSAIGIKHYELALTDIEKGRTEYESLKKPKYEKGQALQPVKCDICMGKVKEGFPIIKCSCGKIYHEPCAKRAGKCGCGVEFK